MAQPSRPLSPHLFIYRPQVTMVMSIVHRITGIGSYLGIALLAWWLVAAAWSEDALAFVNGIMGHWLGLLIMIGFTWSLFNHMIGGIRHFFWDMGTGFSEKARFGFAWLTVVGGILLTVVVWAFVLLN